MKSIADATGFYQTSPGEARFWWRSFPSLAFYTSLVLNVIKHSRLAQHNLYDIDKCRQSCLAVLRALERTGIQVRIEGLDHLNRFPGPCVFVANHMSTLETLVLPGIIPPAKNSTFVVKRGVVEYPVFKHIILALQPIVVDRVNPRADLQTVLVNGARALERGRSVVVFPQTTRVLDFDPQKFNSIGVKLARRAGVPIVPIAVRTDAWRIGRFIKDFGPIDPSKPVYFAFGEAIDPGERGNAAHQAVLTFIQSKLETWQKSVD